MLNTGKVTKAIMNGLYLFKAIPQLAAYDQHSGVHGRHQRYERHNSCPGVRDRIVDAIGLIRTGCGLGKLTGKVRLCFVTDNLMRVNSIRGSWNSKRARIPDTCARHGRVSMQRDHALNRNNMGDAPGERDSSKSTSVF